MAKLIQLFNLPFIADLLCQQRLFGELDFFFFAHLAYSARPVSYSASVILDEIWPTAEYAKSIYFFLAYSGSAE